MTTRVARSGRYLPWIAMALWATVTVLLMPLASKASTVQSTDVALALPQSAAATRALIRTRQAFPGADTPIAVVVYARDSGITPQDRAAVAADRAAFAALSRDSAVAPAVPSADGQALLLSFPIADADADAGADAGPGSGSGSAPGSRAKTVDQIKKLLGDSPAGLHTAVTGSAGALGDAAEALDGADTTLLLAAACVVAVLLLITYRSPVLWLVPLVSVGLASQLATAVQYLLARYAGVTVTPDNSGITLVLLFGVGTDYALLLIARYREELRRHADRYTAMAIAMRRSFPAILASAATVTLGMLCLLAAQMNDARGLGPVAAAGIVVVLVVMTTLLPALLVLLGRWVFWPFIPRYLPAVGAEVAERDVTERDVTERDGAERDGAEQHGIWHRLAETIGRRPRPIWIGATLALVALCFGVLGLRIGQAADEAYTTEVGSVVGQRLVNAHYPDGTSAPAEIIAAGRQVDGVLAAAAAVDGVAAVRQIGTSADGRWVRIEAVLSDPPDSAAAKGTVDRLRDALHAVPDADALVGGATATTLDIERATARDSRILLPLILAVVFIVLVLLLRALVAPLLLAASVVLSYLAAMGVAGLVFQALGHPGIVWFLPMYAYLFLVTLGVDYTIFLMTRAREEVRKAGHHKGMKAGNRKGILAALTVTGGVITSAGLVLAATFATLIFLPLVTALQMGLIVAIGVLLDTFIVRTLLVPTLAVDIGPRVWWPGRPGHRPAQPQPDRRTLEPSCVHPS